MCSESFISEEPTPTASMLETVSKRFNNYLVRHNAFRQPYKFLYDLLLDAVFADYPTFITTYVPNHVDAEHGLCIKWMKKYVPEKYWSAISNYNECYGLAALRLMIDCAILDCNMCIWETLRKKKRALARADKASLLNFLTAVGRRVWCTIPPDCADTVLSCLDLPRFDIKSAPLCTAFSDGWMFPTDASFRSRVELDGTEDSLRICEALDPNYVDEVVLGVEIDMHMYKIDVQFQNAMLTF